MGTWRYLVCALAAVGAACGGKGDGDSGSSSNGGSSTGGSSTGGASGSGAGGSSGNAGSSTGGSAGSGGSNVGGTAGSAGSSAGGSAGSSIGMGDCAGAFGTLSPLFADESWLLGTPSLTADELEIYYVESDSAVPRTADRIARRTREAKTEPFSEPFVLPEPSAPCNPDYEVLSIDVSEDGLRLYFVCTEASSSTSNGTLRVAERPDRNSPFTVSNADLGSVGRSIALSSDELTLYSIRTTTNWVGPDMYRRDSIDEPFGTPVVTPGLDVELGWPDPSHDGLELYGTQTSGASLLVARRASTTSPFSAPVSDGLPPVAGSIYYVGATISADCRSLYLLQLSTTTGPRTMVVARR